MTASKNEGMEAMHNAQDAYYEALQAKDSLTPLERAELSVWRQNKALRGGAAGMDRYEREAVRELENRPAMVAAKDKQ